jgi:uncharacterized membrane protein
LPGTARIALCGMLILAFISLLPGTLGDLAGGAILPFVLVVPGCMLAYALFGSQLDGFERIALTIGLSLTILILGGLLLNLFPPGLNNTTWLAYIVIVTALATWMMIVRGSWNGIRWKPPIWHTKGLARLGILCGSLVITVGAVAFDIAGAKDQPATRFTQLWMVSSQTGSSIRVGISNDERSTMTYHLRLHLGRRTLVDWQTIHLAGAQTWARTVKMPVQFARGHLPVSAALYRGEVSSTPYRTVSVYPAL